MNRIADFIALSVCAALIAAMTGYQLGYDAAKAECKPVPSYEIKPMTHKQKVRYVQWMNRDKGWIK